MDIVHQSMSLMVTPSLMSPADSIKEDVMKAINNSTAELDEYMLANLETLRLAALVKQRRGCGTAWVAGMDKEVNSALPPVLTIPKTRKVIVQVNHKLCVWHITDAVTL
jgi:hypothetical protein